MFVPVRYRRVIALLFTLLVPLFAMTAVFAVSAAPDRSPTAISASPLDVVISEIAWMGTTSSSNDEWLELRNNTATAVVLDGWRLVAADGTPDIALSGIIPANGYFLLERTDDSSTPVLADLLYTGALLNTGEVLTLTDALAVVIDVANDAGSWFAGDNTSKETMVRIAPLADGTLPSSWGNGPIDGNPTNSIQDSDTDTFGFSPNINWVAGDGGGYTAFAEDCDDNDDTIFPDNPELLDMKDNNCNGEIDETFVLGELAYDVYFSSDTALTAVAPTTDVTVMEAALLSVLNSADEAIDAAIYGFNRASLRDALIAAHNRGVAVRVIGDDEAVDDPEYGLYYEALITAGIPVISDTFSSIQHNKFAVIDGAITWSGSTNWTDTGFTYNMNNGLLFTDTYISLAYTMEFEEMFSGSFSGDKADNTPHVFTYTNAIVEIYFAPSDAVEQQVLDAVESVDDTFQFAHFFWTLESLGQVTAAKFITDGVDIWGTWDALGAGNVSSQDDPLCAAGIPIRVEDFGGKLHHKVGVMDAFSSDPTVVTGSFNWTASGADSNDENILIIHNADIAASFYEEMVRLYTAIDRTPCNPSPLPVADFSADIVSGIAPFTTTLTNLSRGIVLEWEWDFGDGITTIVPVPQHSYTVPGTYTVTLTAVGDGVEDTMVKVGYVTVIDGADLAYIYLPAILRP